MCNITVKRYLPDTGVIEPDGTIRRVWDGWIEPDDKTWIAFVDMEGRPTFFLDRDPVSGAVR